MAPSIETRAVGASPSAALNRRDANSYDFVRFCAASAVLFSHHFDLKGLPEPVVPGYGEDFGQLGVQVFFCLSGFLICRSLQKSADWALFVSARVLRIFPNLAFVLVTTSVFTMVWYGNYAHLWAHTEYVLNNLLMFVQDVTFEIPGIFSDAVHPSVNDPLWSLPYELWMYVLLFLLFAIGGRWTRIYIIGFALAFSAVWGVELWTGDFDIGPFNSADLSNLGTFFLSGAVLALFWSRLERHALAVGFAGLIGVFLLAYLLPYDSLLHSLAMAAVVGLGSSKAMAWFAKGGDPSYGMYVFAWPVQQFSLLLIGSFWLSMGVAFLVTMAIGYGTWHGFEKRAMTYRKALAQRLRGSEPEAT